MAKLKHFLFMSCLLLGAAFNCQAAPAKPPVSALYESKKILEFICLHSSCKPNISEITQQNYLIQILGCLQNKKVFNTVTKLLVDEDSLALTKEERGLLLSLSLYQYSKSTGLYWSKVRESVGELPYINVFFDAVDSSSQQDVGYAAYKIAQGEMLVLQLNGRGAHNNSYFLWHVKIASDKFSATLLDVPRYIEKSKPFEINHEFTAKGCFYDEKNKHLIVNMNNDDINSDQDGKNTYEIKNGKLILVR